MKKWLAIFLAVLLALGLTVALAEGDDDVGETSEWISGWNWYHPEGHEEIMRLTNYMGGPTTDFVIPATAKLFGADVAVEIELNGNDFGENVTSIVIDGAKLIISDEADAGIFSYKKLKKLQLKNVTCEGLTSMEWFLGECEELTDLDISCLDTSNVTTMKGMFVNCFKLSSIETSWMKTSNVTDMTGMFINCEALTSLDLSGFDTSKVEYFYQMFEGCAGLQSVNLSSFKTSAALSFAQMFQGCKQLASLDLSGFDTSSAEWMDAMFLGCESLSELDVSSFNMEKVTDANNIFTGCTKVNKITLGEGFRFVGNGEEVCVFPDVYYGPEWISANEKKSFSSTDISENRGGIADTYTRENPYTLSGVPGSVKAAKASKGVTISWKKVSGADYYHIYRAEDKKLKNFRFLQEVTGKTLKYTDTSLKEGKEVAYYVLAVNDFYGSLIDSTDGPSAVVNWMKLAEVKNLKGTNKSAGTLSLSWKKVTGATGYDVYYSTAKKAPTASTKATQTSKKTSLTVKKLKKGKTYYVYVRPYVKLSNKTTVYGDWTKAVKVKITK